MKRRQVLAGFGGVVCVGSLGIGSGAFDSVDAERSVRVAVGDDEQAFLRVESLPTASTRAVTTDGTVIFSIDGTASDATGVGVDSVYRFRSLIRVENQGTQPVEVSSTYEGPLADLALLPDGETDPIDENRPIALGVGEGFDAGLYLDTHGTAPGAFATETLTVHAVDTDESGP